jgi:hypothetical protein
MHITITHKQTVQQAIEMTDRAVDEVFKGPPGVPVEIVEQQKRWIGAVMSFGFTAKMGFVKYPVRGTVEVTEGQYIVDVDLMMFGRLLPNKAQKVIEARWRALLS